MIDECLVVEFRISGDDCPLGRASQRASAHIDAHPPLLRPDGNALLRFSADTSPSLDRALESDDRIRYLHAARGADRTTYRCLSLAPCVLHHLADAGLLVESVSYSHGDEHLAGSVVGTEVLEGVLSAAGDAVGVTLERMHPLGSELDDSASRQWDLTAAQEEALRAGLRMGYFAVPKESTASEVAASIGISKSAYLERLRRGQSSLFRQLFG